MELDFGCYVNYIVELGFSMARKTRSQEVIEKIKDQVIEEAMQLILEAGFNNMSLRKLANRVGMSPTHILLLCQQG